MPASELVKMGNKGGCCFSAIKEIDMKNENWDDKTDEIFSYCVDYKEDGMRNHLFIEENRNIERFRVRCFRNGVEYGSPMTALDWEGVDAIISLISGKKRKGWRVA